MPTTRELTTVIQDIAPDLKAVGWKKFGTTFNREAEAGLVHVINFQGSQWGGKFTVNLGVYVREIDRLFDDWWGRQGKVGEPGRDAVVREDICWLSERLGRMGPENEDRWWAYDNPAAEAEDIRIRLARDAAPAFDEVSSRAKILEIWPLGSGVGRWRIERRSPLGYAILLNAAGRSEEARAVIEEVRRKARGMPFFHVATMLGEELGFEMQDESGPQ